MDSGLATGLGLPHHVCHLPMLLHPHRVQRFHLRQPSNVPRHPLTSPHLLLRLLLPLVNGGNLTWLPVSRRLETKSYLLFFQLEKYRALYDLSLVQYTQDRRHRMFCFFGDRTGGVKRKSPSSGECCQSSHEPKGWLE